MKLRYLRDWFASYRVALIVVISLVAAYLFYPHLSRKDDRAQITEIVFWTPTQLSDQLRVGIEAFERRYPQYEVVTGWGQSTTMGVVSDVAVDSQDRVYLAVRNAPHPGTDGGAIMVLDRGGKLLNSWGQDLFTTPHGIWVDSRDRVYVTDRENNRVQIFSLEGDYITEWRDFFHPMDIFMDSNDKFYVSDQIPRISILNSEGALLSRGKAAANPHGIWGDSNGNLYTAGNHDGVTKYDKL